jgi:hypothetical protein
MNFHPAVFCPPGRRPVIRDEISRRSRQPPHTAWLYAMRDQESPDRRASPDKNAPLARPSR